MKPLIVLLSIFGISLIVFKLNNSVWQPSLSGRMGMSAMLLFTSIGHFAFLKSMQMMLPRIIPLKKAIIVATGFIEIAAAIGLLIPAVQQLTGWLVILFFTLILPANISAAIRHINYQKGTTDGPGPVYLLFRIPLQLFFIVWVYWFAIHN